ncbi:MAG: GAF domain-containing protein [Anaerolineae bacterium]|nr:GAF domain-containing protein [Anaerolineae bacterium]MDW8297794.1 GAF domain-containing protein [Anaerolineae bacterium]
MYQQLPRIFPLTAYSEPLDRRRAAVTYTISAVMFFGALLSGLSLALQTLSGSTSLDLAILMRSVLLGGVALAAYSLTRNAQQTVAALLILLAWSALLFLLALSDEISAVIGFGGMLVGISLGALLIGEQTVLYTLIAALLYTLFELNAPLESAPENSSALIVIGLPLLIVHAGVNYTMARNLRLVTRQITANIEERSVRLAKASADLVQRVLGVRLALETVLQETVRLVQEHFNDCHEVQLFLVDRDHRNATLVATTHEASRPNVGKYQVGVGSLSVIGRVTISGQSVLVREESEALPYRRSAFLSGTRVQLAIPLRVGNDIIGAIDLQSHNVNAFAPEDVEALETLANQIAVAVDNARLFAEMQEKLTENRRLYEQASAQLREIERLNRQLTGGVWADYLSSMGSVPAFTIDLVNGRVEDAAEQTPTLAEAIRRSQPVLRTFQSHKILAMPIAVRGQVIGAMEFELALDQDISNEQIAVLQQVIERLGLAVENLRLLEEAQRMAQRESMINEITARMQAATSVEAVIATATQSLADAFQAPHVAVRLGLPTPGSNLNLESRNRR